MPSRRRLALLLSASVVAVAVVIAFITTNLPSAPSSIADEPGPKVTASGNPTTGTAPLTVHFSATVVGSPSPLSYRWSFGDGTSGSGASVSHTYRSPGTYTATVVGTDDRGRSGSSSVGVQVNAPTSPPGSPSCKMSDPASRALCFRATVARVIDGDTLETDDGTYVDRIRLVLVDAPESGEPGGTAARDYLTTLCLDTVALVDEDDWQVGDDPYGRILAVVYCGSTNANTAMIASGHADTYYSFCTSSEFGSETWTGCSSLPPPPPPGNCDPAYPDVCIPPPPPDLDCADIPYTNFRVYPPDPHYFDGDRDGIGCESGWRPSGEKPAAAGGHAASEGQPE